MATGSPVTRTAGRGESAKAQPSLSPPRPGLAMFPATGWASPDSLSAKETRGCVGSFLGLNKRSKTSKSANIVEKKDCIPGIYGTSLPLNSFSHQTSGTRGLESDCSAKKKSSLPEDKIAPGGVFANPFYKDQYKAAMEQLAALQLSNNTRTAQHDSNSSKQGSIHSWSRTHNQGNNSVSRNFKLFMQIPSNSNDVPMNFARANPLLHSYMKRYYLVSYSGTQKTTSESPCRNGGGDFCEKGNETTASGFYSTTDSSSDDMLSALKRQMKRGNGNVDDTPLVEEDTSESEKRNKALLKYLKNVNTNLKPEPIEHKEGTSSSMETDTFSYPDFLPPPYNTWDLQKLSKLDDWRLALNEPLGEPLDKLIPRLVEMERLQHLTILREKTRETASPTVAVNNRSGSSKDVQQLKQLRSSDPSCSQAAFDGDLQNFGTCVHEPELAKCMCQYCHNKQSSGGSPARSSTKHSRACCSISKCCKAPVTADSSSIASQRSQSCSGSSPKMQTGVKMTSQKLLSSNTTAGYSLPESETSKYKQARTKRKSCRKNGTVMDKPINSQRLNSVSVISKQKCSDVDYQ